MKKVSSFLLVLFSSITLFSCGNKVDNRLNDFSKENLINFIDEANEFVMKLNRNNIDCGIIKNSESMTIIEEDITYLIKDNKYYSDAIEAKDLDLTNDAIENIEYFVDNYAYAYKNYLDDMNYKGDIKFLGYSCYKYEAIISHEDKNKTSGFIFYIEKESGITLKQDTYGNNASLFDKTGLKFEVSEFSYSL